MSKYYTQIIYQFQCNASNFNMSCRFRLNVMTSQQVKSITKQHRHCKRPCLMMQRHNIRIKYIIDFDAASRHHNITTDRIDFDAMSWVNNLIQNFDAISRYHTRHTTSYTYPDTLTCRINLDAMPWLYSSLYSFRCNVTIQHTGHITLMQRHNITIARINYDVTSDDNMHQLWCNATVLQQVISIKTQRQDITTDCINYDAT